MRITGGSLRGRIFSPPADKWPTRPTTDISREALFNILQNQLDFENIRMLDLFGGSGAHSYEFASRGTKTVDYVDKHKACCQFVKNQLKVFNIENIIKVYNIDFERYIKKSAHSYDYIFAGPPYGLENLDQIPEMIFNSTILTPGGLFVLEHNPDHNFEKYRLFNEHRKYGQTIFSFFRP